MSALRSASARRVGHIGTPRAQVVHGPGPRECRAGAAEVAERESGAEMLPYGNRPDYRRAHPGHGPAPPTNTMRPRTARLASASQSRMRSPRSVCGEPSIQSSPVPTRPSCAQWPRQRWQQVVQSRGLLTGPPRPPLDDVCPRLPLAVHRPPVGVDAGEGLGCRAGVERLGADLAGRRPTGAGAGLRARLFVVGAHSSPPPGARSRSSATASTSAP